jgi:hypothetical protein
MAKDMKKDWSNVKTYDELLSVYLDFILSMGD